MKASLEPTDSSVSELSADSLTWTVAGGSEAEPPRRPHEAPGARDSGGERHLNQAHALSPWLEVPDSHPQPLLASNLVDNWDIPGILFRHPVGGTGTSGSLGRPWPPPSHLAISQGAPRVPSCRISPTSFLLDSSSTSSFPHPLSEPEPMSPDWGWGHVTLYFPYDHIPELHIGPDL